MSALSLQGFPPSPQTLLASSCSVWTMGFLSPNESRGLKAPLFPPRGVCGGSVPPGSGQAAAACTFPAAGGFSPSRRAARRFGKLPCTCLLHFAASASQRRSSFSRDNVPLCAGLPAGRGRGGCLGARPRSPGGFPCETGRENSPRQGLAEHAEGCEVGEEEKGRGSCRAAGLCHGACLSLWWLCPC